MIPKAARRHIISNTTLDDPAIGSDGDLRHRLLEYQAILDNASLGITFTRNRTFLHCNQRFSEMYGWTSEELLGKPTNILYPSQEAFDELSGVATPILGSGGKLDTELLMKRRDGSLFWCRMLGRAIDPHDHGKGTIFITEDITERKEAEEASKQLLLEYEAILDNATLGITFTRKHQFIRCNERFSEMFGWPSGALIGQSTRVVYPNDDAYDNLTATARPILLDGRRFDTEVKLKRRDGSLFWCRLIGRALDPHDRTKGTIYITEDITERRNAQKALLRARDELEQRVEERTRELAMANARLHAEIQERKLAEQQIRYLANHDALTGLPNRRLLEDRLEQAMEMARRKGGQAAVLFIDLDRFKPINDRLGHRIGDLLLQAVAVRLRSLLRAMDTVSRVGGDEFVIVLPETSSATAAADAAQRVLAALAQSYCIDGHDLSVTPSIGISMFPNDGESTEDLLSAADAAMYYAKKVGRANVQLFAPEMRN